MVTPMYAGLDEAGHPEFLGDEWWPTDAEMQEMYSSHVNSSPLSLYNGVDCSPLAALVNTCKHQQIICELMAQRWARMAEALSALAQGEHHDSLTSSP